MVEKPAKSGLCLSVHSRETGKEWPVSVTAPYIAATQCSNLSRSCDLV